MPVVRPVAGVVVQQDVGPPASEHPGDQGPRLGGLDLEVVPVEVEPDRRAAPAHLLGAVLVDAVVAAATLVGVDREDRQHEQDRVVDQVLSRLRHRDVAHQGEGGVFALDLSGVDAVLDQHDRLAGRARRLGREGAVA